MSSLLPGAAKSKGTPSPAPELRDPGAQSGSVPPAGPVQPLGVSGGTAQERGELANKVLRADMVA